MKEMPDDCVDLIVSSPPYFNLREYSQWETYEDYIIFIYEVAFNLHRILKPGRSLFWNIQDSYPKPLINKDQKGSLALSADTIKKFQSAGFTYECNIVWYKGKGGATQRMFGSYPYPPTFLISKQHENILFFRKSPGFKIPISRQKEESLITKQEWVQYTNSLWEFNPETHESQYQLSHPAVFPTELPYRCIKLWSFIADTIFDPFIGSGTTATVAKGLKRNFIGIEINPDYCKIAEERLSQGVL